MCRNDLLIKQMLEFFQHFIAVDHLFHSELFSRKKFFDLFIHGFLVNSFFNNFFGFFGKVASVASRHAIFLHEFGITFAPTLGGPNGTHGVGIVALQRITLFGHVLIHFFKLLKDGGRVNIDFLDHGWIHNLNRSIV